MTKHYFALALTLIFLLFSEIAFCYQIGNPPYWYYIPTGYYEASNHRNNNMYQNHIERNKYEFDKWYCLIKSPNSEWGYKIQCTSFGCGYFYQNEIGGRTRVKCHKILDGMPVVYSFNQARNMKY